MNILKQTADGSYTFFNEEIGEHYHSAHGALQESKHVFLEAGFVANHQLKKANSYAILEMGFGTGLNFLISAAYAQSLALKLNYVGIEAYPLCIEDIAQTQLQNQIPTALWNEFTENYAKSITSIAASSLESPYPFVDINKTLQLAVLKNQLEELSFRPQFDLIYYDAFSVRHQPELWTTEVITKICEALLPGGIFVSYAITGNLKRALQAAGLKTEKLPGPPGKREMIRAHKL